PFVGRAKVWAGTYEDPAENRTLDRICTAILRNEAAVLNVSTLLTGYHGISDIYLGVLCIVDRNGVRNILPLSINDMEVELLNASANKLKGIIHSISGSL